MSKFNQKLLSVFIAVLGCLHFHHHHQAVAQSTTVRPYKFGFTIDEQQHRYESRDERGIVMGEFGFITADGIYHVTVYATDEEGRFRILAMKSYPYESKPTTFEIMMKPKKAPSTTTTTTTTTTTVKPTLPRQKFYNEACSGCFLTNGNSNTAADKPAIQTLSKPLPSAGANQPKSPNLSTNSGSKPKPNLGTAANQPGKTNGVTGAASLHIPKLMHLNEHQQNAHPLGRTQTTTSQHTQSPTYGHTTKTQPNFVTSKTTTSAYKTSSKIPNRMPEQYTKPHYDTNVQKIFKVPGYEKTPMNTHNSKQNTGLTHSTTATSTFATNSHQSKTAGNNGFGSVPGYKQFPAQPQTSTNTHNIGLQQQTPSTNLPKPYTQETIGNNDIPSTQTQTHSSNRQDPSTSANAQPQRPVMQPNVMNVIVNKVLPSVMGLNGVVAKPTTAGAPSSRTPLNSVTPSGKSGNINPTYGKANSNPQYKPNAGSGKGAGAGTAAAAGTAATAGRAAGGAAAAGGDGDLYRFKYILDYHGHTETGKRNGNKEGNYFAIGDDDIERTIEYVADENGYQPRIHWRKLSNPVPSKENTLKDYEFVWFTLK